MIRIILQASEIPNNTFVTKPTGEVEYKLKKDGIKIYSQDATEILYEKSALLINKKGITVIPFDMKLAVELTIEDAIKFLSSIQSLRVTYS